jgi:hypothetical protein
VAAVAHPRGLRQGAEAHPPAEATGDPLDQQFRQHQPVGRLDRVGGSERQLELGSAVLGMELQPGQPGGVEGIQQGSGVVETLHQAVGAVGAAGQGGGGLPRGAGVGHQPLDLEAGGQRHPLGGEGIAAGPAEAALIGGVGAAIPMAPVTGGPEPALRRLQRPQGGGIGHQAQIAVGNRQRMLAIRQAVDPPGVADRRETHPQASRRREAILRHHLHQHGAGMVHEGHRHAARGVGSGHAGGTSPPP